MWHIHVVPMILYIWRRTKRPNKRFHSILLTLCASCAATCMYLSVLRVFRVCIVCVFEELNKIKWNWSFSLPNDMANTHRCTFYNNCRYCNTYDDGSREREKRQKCQREKMNQFLERRQRQPASSNDTVSCSLLSLPSMSPIFVVAVAIARHLRWFGFLSARIADVCHFSSDIRTHETGANSHRAFMNATFQNFRTLHNQMGKFCSQQAHPATWSRHIPTKLDR